MIPFRVEVPENRLVDLQERLARTRWPEAETVGDWSQGVPLAYLEDLCGYWADGYDWRRAEARLNAFPQYRTEIDGLGIHFVHARSAYPGALPLVLTTGWPGSVMELLDVIRPLTDDPENPFHVVCPALPGFGFSDKPDAERDALTALEHAKQWEDGYSAEQATKPQTIGYSLVDSPAGLAAWIVEKFRTWADPASGLSRDQILDSVMMYWLPGTGASAARLYWESIRQVQEWFTSGTTDTVTVPTGCSIFPKENPRPSRRWAARRYVNIVHWNELDRGGHFAAFEQPGLFVDEVRAFFRRVRV